MLEQLLYIIPPEHHGCSGHEKVSFGKGTQVQAWNGTNAEAAFLIKHLFPGDGIWKLVSLVAGIINRPWWVEWKKADGPIFGKKLKYVLVQLKLCLLLIKNPLISRKGQVISQPHKWMTLDSRVLWSSGVGVGEGSTLGHLTGKWIMHNLRIEI